MFRKSLDPRQRKIADRGRLAFQKPGDCFCKVGYFLFIRHTPDYKLTPAEDGTNESDNTNADQE